jgi:hypothetical protein
VKKVARVIAFYGLCFPMIFVITAGLGFLQQWIGAAADIPVRTSLAASDVLNATGWALPVTLSLTIVFTIEYGRKKKAAGPAVFALIVLLSTVFSWGVSRGFSNVRAMDFPPFLINRVTLGKPGLILQRGDTLITLLDWPSAELGSRVVSIPDRPLIYQEIPIGADGQPIKLPRAPFKLEYSGFVEDIRADLNLSALHLAERFEGGSFTFFEWILPLIILLTGLGYVFFMSNWPLANVCFTLLVFRLVLALDVLINSREIIEYLSAFFRERVAAVHIGPFVLGALAALTLIYKVLYVLTKGRGKNGKEK